MTVRGCFLLSRLANYYPEQFSAYAFIDHGYSAPGKSLTFDAMQHVNSVFQDRFGFSIFGYFLFFNEKDAADLSDKHVSSFILRYSICNSIDVVIVRVYRSTLLHK